MIFADCHKKGYGSKKLLSVPGLIGVHPNGNTAMVWLRTEGLLVIIREHGNPVTLCSVLPRCIVRCGWNMLVNTCGARVRVDLPREIW